MECSKTHADIDQQAGLNMIHSDYMQYSIALSAAVQCEGVKQRNKLHFSKSVNASPQLHICLTA